MVESNRNSDIEALRQRALKITEALYRTTDIMFDGEQLNWSLRNNAVEIINIVSGFDSGIQVNEINRLNKLINNLFLKLELASSGTYISRVNFEVLRREYSMLNHTIEEQSKSPILLDLPTIEQASARYRTKENITDIESDNRIKMSDMLIGTNIEEKKELKNIIDENSNQDRKSVIVSALKNMGPSSISDVAKLFNGTIGEKTVQRELNNLGEAGSIKKEGEKRWRRYYL